MVGYASFKYDSNVIMIDIDSVSHDVFRCAKTPNIDALGGTHFDKAYSSASQTLGSYYIRMLGHLPYQDGSEQIFGSVFWLPLEFKKKGYHTIAIVSMPHLSVTFGCGRGWDHFVLLPRYNFSRGLIETAIGRLKHQPLFMFLNIGDTHSPYTYEGSQGTIWKAALFNPYNYHKQDTLSDQYLAYLRWKQIEALEHVDKQLKVLFDAIDKSRTTIIITADHGELFGENHTFGHGIGFHENLYHVPLIIIEPRK